MLFTSGEARSPFTSYEWYQALCKHVLHRDPAVLSVSFNDRPVALLPAEIQQGTIRMIQDERVSDYTDIIIEPGCEYMVIAALADYIDDHDLSLDLFPLDPTSVMIARMPESLAGIAISDLETCPFLLLPASWDDYLYTLSGKLRHELRRKLKRAAGIRLHGLDADGLGTFLELMARSEHRKHSFLTDDTRSFFNDIARSFASRGWLRMRGAFLDSEPVAALFSFQTESTIFLYNSGYDPRLNHLAPGIIAIALDIKDAIEEGIGCYDFLRGTEEYKLRFGAILRSTVRVQR